MRQEDFNRLLEVCGVPRGARILAAVSGGADSVCLLRLLCGARPGYPLTVLCAHAEHGIRGEASLADEAYVRALCAQWDVRFFSRHLDVPTQASRMHRGLEETARTLRYAFLREIAAQEGCSCIATAHHRRDQAETVLLHIARGSDIRGLCAMRMREGDLIRPLLGCAPEALRNLLQEEGITWREDETNADTQYSRNLIRHTVLPALEQIAPGAEEALCRLALAGQRVEACFDAQLRDIGADHPIRLADGAALPEMLLRGRDPALTSRAVARLLDTAGAQRSSAVIDRAAQWLSIGHEGTLNLEEGGRLSIGGGMVCAVFPDRRLPDTPLGDGVTPTPFGRFMLRPAQQGETGDGIASQVVPDGEITVGERHAGETMIPFGHTKPKELRKLISDAGVPAPLRRSMPVVRMEGEPVWLPGVRPAERCRQNGGVMRMLVWMDRLPL